MPMLGLTALLVALWITPPCETGFCSCVGPRDVPSSVASADAVFTGRVVRVRNVTHGGRQLRRVTLRVDRAWKGVDSRTVVVITGSGGGDCGFPFRRRESYLVFAGERTDGLLGTGLCGRTAELSRAAADIRDLGPPALRWTR